MNIMNIYIYSDLIKKLHFYFPFVSYEHCNVQFIVSFHPKLNGCFFGVIDTIDYI